MQQRRWVAEARAAADHARQQSRAAAEALAPVYDLDPDDIAWGEQFGTPLRLGNPLLGEESARHGLVPICSQEQSHHKTLPSACFGCDTCRRFSPDNATCTMQGCVSAIHRHGPDCVSGVWRVPGSGLGAFHRPDEPCQRGAAPPGVSAGLPEA